MKTKEDFIQEFINELNKKVEVDLSVIDIDKVETRWDIEEQLYENGAFNYEFIYYYNAMKYLLENDTSLGVAMSKAQEFGYEPKNMNSCLLAQLVKEEELKENFFKYEDDIKEFFEDLPVMVRNEKIDEVLC